MNIQVAAPGKSLDPFGVFVSPRAPRRLYTNDAIRTERGLSFSAGLIGHRWGEALQRGALGSTAASDDDGTEPIRILPHESHGPAARRWISEGLLRPEKLLGGPGYRSLVHDGLDALSTHPRPRIHVVGIVASMGNTFVRLGPGGRENYQHLYATMRPSYVHSRVVAVENTSHGVFIRSRLPQHAEWCSGSPSMSATTVVFADEKRAGPIAHGVESTH